jgi:hypothetical protein
MAEKADKRATLRQVRQLQLAHLRTKTAKTPMFVPLCSARSGTLRNKNRQKSLFLFQGVSLALAQIGTNIGKNGYFCPSLSQTNALTLGQTSHFLADLYGNHGRQHRNRNDRRTACEGYPVTIS